MGVTLTQKKGVQILFHKLHTPWQRHGAHLTTSEALCLFMESIHRLKHTFPGFYLTRQQRFPAQLAPRALWHWDMEPGDDVRMNSDGGWKCLSTCPRAGHHSLICVYAAVPKTWKAEKGESHYSARTQETGIFHQTHLHKFSTSISCEIAHPRSNNATFSYRSKMTGINP